ncbi:MAG: hydroxymethylbilane synthase [Planctomycetes bacterium]|nr:hydroxymethylbilane synthase [Planctomycetota bacterium]MBL7146276.1 hydroxymethylbilane synthase [Phycisphaerae bacterium]
MRSLKIASRASKLALVQSNYICNLLKNLSSNIEISIVEISTKGDRDKSDFLYKTVSMGFFTSEVENALLDGRADLAVHSLKDLPTACTEGLVVAAIPKRESVADALIASSQAASIAALPAGATVGTSSLRRIAQLHRLRDDIKCVPLRGNVETRVSKVATGKVDAAVIACAGLNRLGLADKISAILPPQEFLPAPAQGALAVQIRTDDNELAKLVSKLDDKQSRIAVEAERAILSSMHGGCSIPLGVYSQIAGDNITINAVISDVEGDKYIKSSKTANINEAKSCAEELAQELLQAGGREILDQIRNSRNG